MLYEKVIDYCKKSHISLSSFEKRCGLGNGTIKGWVDSSPRIDSLQKVAREMGVTVDSLLADEPEAG